MSKQSGQTILLPQEGQPVEAINIHGKGPVLIICEHASNTIPTRLDGLGLSDEASRSHAAWDPGALAVSKLMSQELDATLVAQRFSRLVYDCNRPPEAPDAMPARSEIYDVPGNITLSQDDRQARIEEIYRPFENAIASLIEERLSQDIQPVIVTMHSFTPVYYGKQREVELGILFDKDARLGEAILSQKDSHPSLKMDANEPYSATDGVTHTLRLHALPNNLLNVMIEVRNDLIGEEEGQTKMAHTLCSLITQALAQMPAQDGPRTAGAI